MVEGRPLRSLSKEWIQTCHSTYYYTSGHIAGTTQISCQTSAQSQQSRRNLHVTPDMNFLGASNRITLAVCGEFLVRIKFHNVPVDFPPPPGALNQSMMHEHFYCNNSNQ